MHQKAPRAKTRLSDLVWWRWSQTAADYSCCLQTKRPHPQILSITKSKQMSWTFTSHSFDMKTEIVFWTIHTFFFNSVNLGIFNRAQWLVLEPQVADIWNAVFALMLFSNLHLQLKGWKFLSCGKNNIWWLENTLRIQKIPKRSKDPSFSGKIKALYHNTRAHIWHW